MIFLFYVRLIASIKNSQQNMWENIVQCWFYKTNIKKFSLISKPHTHTFANLPLKCHCWLHKTNTVIYYFRIMIELAKEKIYNKTGRVLPTEKYKIYNLWIWIIIIWFVLIKNVSYSLKKKLRLSVFTSFRLSGNLRKFF